MDRLPAVASGPLLAMRVVPERPDEGERFSPISGTEQSRRLRAGVDHVRIAWTAWLDLPDPLDTAAEFFGETYGCALSFGPGVSAVIGVIDAGTPMLTRTADEEPGLPASGIDAGAIDGLHS